MEKKGHLSALTPDKSASCARRQMSWGLCSVSTFWIQLLVSLVVSFSSMAEALPLSLPVLREDCSSPHSTEGDLQPVQIRSCLSATPLKSNTAQSLFHMHQCIQGNGSSFPLVLTYHRRTRLIALPLILCLQKGRKIPKPTKQTLFSVSNTESELWNFWFRYKQWSRYKSMQRNKFYFLPTDGNQQMLKSATVRDRHVDIHSYVLITSSLGKLRRKAQLKYFRVFRCCLSGNSQWGVKEMMLQKSSRDDAHKKDKHQTPEIPFQT